jgi:type I restriction enzyme S subunit
VVQSLLVPIPPLAEQHRIVAKADELMVLCDNLKKRLHDAQTTQVQLADAIVEQAV